MRKNSERKRIVPVRYGDQASQFVDAASGDFRLKAGSQAVDAGETVPGISGSYAGAAPDAGALEYGEPMWATGAAIERPVFDGELDPTERVNATGEDK